HFDGFLNPWRPGRHFLLLSAGRGNADDKETTDGNETCHDKFSWRKGVRPLLKQTLKIPCLLPTILDNSFPQPIDGFAQLRPRLAALLHQVAARGQAHV